jgi:LmbE family N-acetylglucosaminyl deacetylase
MRGLTVLSPHRDDAVFSLYFALRKWRREGVRLTVLNFFTRSNYAPGVSEKQTDAVSLIRKTEDRNVLSRIDKGIDVRDCGLLDAPLRLGIEFAAVCNPETRALAKSVEPEIAAYIRTRAFSDLIIAPLGLGGHVDHLAVNEAAIASTARNHKPAFYEDLPYATWTSSDMLRQRIHEIETKLGARLRPVIIRQRYAIPQKQGAAARYRSQITRQEAASIARFSLRYGGGERLWIPKHSKLWTVLAR